MLKKFLEKKLFILSTGSQGEPMGAMNRIVNGITSRCLFRKVIQCIFSSKIIPGNEKKLYQCKMK